MSYELLTTQTADPRYPAPVVNLEPRTVNLLFLSAISSIWPLTFFDLEGFIA
jgi:hypothetical protein